MSNSLLVFAIWATSMIWVNCSTASLTFPAARRENADRYRAFLLFGVRNEM